MTRLCTTVAVVALGVCVAGVVGAAEHKTTKSAGKKPVATCKQIVETYKVNNSVDETADALVVDQSVVAACLKVAGIVPKENDR